MLEQERTIRNQKEQYSALARRIHQYPSREETQAEITRLEGEIQQLEQESGAVASALELRSKRFAGFMHALHDMQLLLESEAAQARAPRMHCCSRHRCLIVLCLQLWKRFQ